MKDTILESIKSWEKKNKDIKTVIVIGSSIRQSNKGDKYSDIDLIIVTKDPFKYEKSSHWISEIYQPVSFHNGYEISKGNYVKRIFFENEIAVDITFLDYKMLNAASLYALLKEKLPIVLKLLGPYNLKKIEKQLLNFTYYLHRGYYLLSDRNDTGSKIKRINRECPYKTEYSFELQEFELVVNRFWQNAYRAAFKIKRNELFTAKLEHEPEMKQDLLNIIEIFSKYKNGQDYETWHKGRFIEQWADPFIVEKMVSIYGTYDAENTWNALQRTISLFSTLSAMLFEFEIYKKIENPEPYFKKWIQEIEQTLQFKLN